MSKKHKTLSIRALAGELGRSDTAIRKWIKRGRWPFGAGPWAAKDLPRIREWVATLQDNRAAGETAPPSEDDAMKRRLTIKLLSERAMILEQTRKKNDANLQDAATEASLRQRKLDVVRAELMTIVDLAPGLSGSRPLQERERLLEDWAKGVCDQLANATI